jgi:hypothetical protein
MTSTRASVSACVIDHNGLAPRIAWSTKHLEQASDRERRIVIGIDSNLGFVRVATWCEVRNAICADATHATAHTTVIVRVQSARGGRRSIQEIRYTRVRVRVHCDSLTRGGRGSIRGSRGTTEIGAELDERGRIVNRVKPKRRVRSAHGVGDQNLTRETKAGKQTQE